MHATDETCFVYVMSCRGFCKIGIAGDIVKRLITVQSGNPFRVELEAKYAVPRVYVRRAEAIAHQALDSWRGLGEWFKVTPAKAKQAVEESIEAAASEYEAADQPQDASKTDGWDRDRDFWDALALVRASG